MAHMQKEISFNKSFFYDSMLHIYTTSEQNPGDIKKKRLSSETRNKMIRNESLNVFLEKCVRKIRFQNIVQGVDTFFSLLYLILKIIKIKDKIFKKLIIKI